MKLNAITALLALSLSNDPQAEEAHLLLPAWRSSVESSEPVEYDADEEITLPGYVSNL